MLSREEQGGACFWELALSAEVGAARTPVSCDTCT